MAAKHKESIVAILKLSGPLPGSTLKERVLNELQITDEQYPKSTFLKHIEQLVDEAKINFNKLDNKRVYFVEEFKHPIQGGLLLENIGGKIFAPGMLLPFDIKIDRAMKEVRDRNKFHLFFEFNSTNICFSIHKDAIPFNIHISRNKNEKISDFVVKNFGSRTVVLELPVSTISSLKPDSLTGHLLVKFLSLKEVSIADLEATNPAELIEINGLSLETFSREISIISNATVRNDMDSRSASIIGRKQLQKREVKNLSLPTMIQMSIDSSLAIF